MGIIAASCPKCGANLNVPDGVESFFCQYCGTKMIKDVDYLDVSVSISIDGLATADSLLERAIIFMSDGRFNKAFTYAERVLDINPKLATAYLVMFICEVGVRNIDELMVQIINPLNYENYNKAVEYSSGKEKEKYIAIANKMIGPAKIKKKQLIEDISKQTMKISQLQKENDKLRKKIKRSENIAIFPNLFFAITLVLFLISIIAVFNIPKSQIVIMVFFWLIPLGGLLTFASIRLKCFNNLPNALKTNDSAIKTNLEVLQDKKDQLKLVE